MIFALLTLLTALALATVAGWFSIIGFMAIWAGAPLYALIMGAVIETSKLVTVSWLYRNWDYSDWKLKVPLMYFTLAVMTATSIGVFGFLSKAHLDQGSDTLNNSAKVEDIVYQISREKTNIANNEKIILQLDATVNKYIEEGFVSRSLSARRSQKAERDQIKIATSESQKTIDSLTAQKFILESEVRKLELDVGPIRYIADLIYGTAGDAKSNIEAAVRIFTLLIVSTLDPLAVTLLIAANHTLMRLRNEKKKATQEKGPNGQAGPDADPKPPSGPDRLETQHYTNRAMEEDGAQHSPEPDARLPEKKDATLHVSIPTETNSVLNAEKDSASPYFAEILREEATAPPPAISENESPGDVIYEILQGRSPKSKDETQEEVSPLAFTLTPPHSFRTRQPVLSRVNRDSNIITTKEEIVMPELTHPALSVQPWAHQASILEELLGSGRHFTPEKVIKEPKLATKKSIYPRTFGWLTEFKRS